MSSSEEVLSQQSGTTPPKTTQSSGEKSNSGTLQTGQNVTLPNKCDRFKWACIILIIVSLAATMIGIIGLLAYLQLIPGSVNALVALGLEGSAFLLGLGVAACLITAGIYVAVQKKKEKAIQHLTQSTS